MKYLVYTDGSCSVKDKTGGFAYLIVDESGSEYLGGGFENDTTISRMELKAAIEALEYIQGEPDSVILLLSDSEYVVKGFMDKTRKRNKNVDLWLYLEELAGQFDLVYMMHVRGHNGHPDNEAVDRLAGEFRQAAVRQL